MKHFSISALFLAAVALLTASCGTSDSIKSLFLTSTGTSTGNFFNLAGADGTLQLKVFSIYNSGKQIDVTNAVTWNVTTVGSDQSGASLPAYGPTSVPINGTGLMTAVASLCTWTDLNAATPPVWQYTGYYQVTATYRGLTSQPVAIGVGSQTSINSPSGGCGPS